VKTQAIKRKVCIGALDRQVTLKSRAIQSPTGGSVDYSENFVSLGSEWANIISLRKGPIFYDGTNIAKQATHIFEIRYRDDVDSETWVEMSGDNYDVLNVMDVDERNEFLHLYAVKRGQKSVAVNQV
jgi:SPP1 family predicted phage head-tail adaptor